MCVLIIMSKHSNLVERSGLDAQEHKRRSSSLYLRCSRRDENEKVAHELTPEGVTQTQETGDRAFSFQEDGLTRI